MNRMPLNEVFGYDRFPHTRGDGACLYKLPPEEDFSVKDVRELAQLAQTRRNSIALFDIVVGHAFWQRRKDAERERACIASLSEAGAT
jgi:hypothetical protein